MQEELIQIIYCVFIILLFVLSYSKNNLEKMYEKVKDKKFTWFWLRLFKIETTKENFIALCRYQSIFVISIMVLGIISTIWFWINK
ncbi:MAG: hypothetical protein WCG93_08370 [Paludibacter sp.]